MSQATSVKNTQFPLSGYENRLIQQVKLALDLTVSGNDAFINGLTPLDCPFPDGSHEALCWLIGWDDMRELCRNVK